tara:strand:- start:12 stop:317 length:306 start_codon:yes stop_codon:yes gene_type:complete
MNTQNKQDTNDYAVEQISVIHEAYEDEPQLVAWVEVPKDATAEKKLSMAYMLTNSIDEGWWENEEVTPLFSGEGCRSTCIGDKVWIGTDVYICERIGWKKI